MPHPDAYGRYRVRRKGDSASPAWSTRNFNPERHVVIPGPASDTYGNALPDKPSRRLDPEPAAPGPDIPPEPDTTEEEESDR